MKTRIIYRLVFLIASLLLANQSMAQLSFLLAPSPTDSLPYYLRSVAQFETDQDTNGLIDIYTKIAQIYHSEKVHTKEQEYYKLASEIVPTTNQRLKNRYQYLTGSAAYHAENYQRATLLFLPLLEAFPEGSVDKTNLCLDLVSCYDSWEKYDSALYYAEALAPTIKNSRGPSEYFKHQNNIAYYQTLIEDYDAALLNYREALLIIPTNHSRLDKARLISNIAVCYVNKGNTKKAISTFNEAILILEEAEAWKEKSRNENMLANLYHTQGDLYNARQFVIDAIASAKEAPDAWKEAESYLSYSKILRDGNDPVNALLYYEKYLNIRDSLEFTRRFQLELLQNKKESLEKSEKELKLKLKEEEINELAIRELSLQNEKMAQEQAILVQQRNLDLLKQDSLRQAFQIQEEQSKLVEQEKENRLLEQEKRIADQLAAEEKLKREAEERKTLIAQNEQRLAELENEKLENGKTVSRYFMAGFGLIIIIIVASYINSRRKNKLLKKQKSEIQEKNTDLEQKNEEISSQRDEIEAQRDIVFDQKQAIEAYNEDIMKSIEYAKRLQTAAIPHLSILNALVDDNFVLFMPRDIVSGDFYWFAEVEGKTIATVADCTGHGVPGAFVSMMGMSLLKELVQKEYLTHPGVILRKMRKEVIAGMGDGEQRDGMDMALVSIDKVKNKFDYAGAYNSLYLIRSKEAAAPIINDSSLEAKMLNGKTCLYEIPADKMPIAKFDVMDKFVNHEIPIEKGDKIYLFSDGYADQFGGEKDKKFMARRFKELLLQHSHEPMHKQHDILKNTIEKWMNEVDQVDDICVMGIAL